MVTPEEMAKVSAYEEYKASRWVVVSFFAPCSISCCVVALRVCVADIICGSCELPADVFECFDIVDDVDCSPDENDVVTWQSMKLTNVD